MKSTSLSTHTGSERRIENVELINAKQQSAKIAVKTSRRKN